MVDPAFDDRGLIPCVVQDVDRGSVLMVAWMNAVALKRTRETGAMHFWSRSRNSLWKKGETSGNTLELVELRVDCDGDTLLALVRPAGPACHTGERSCFYRELDGAAAPDAANIFERVDRVIAQRRDATAETSYTKSLLVAGMPKILAKISEEHGELAAELPEGPDAKVVHEAADLIFHVMVGLAARNVPISRIEAELARRFGTSGHVEKASRT
ncbi:MAG TPA: bifunctional phosphoribosyl-AMP cyclohydrolase/phosphoribosyl-ATP diphosphatase HisIE [Kofleriaceae bacterium]|jgi:phosphoribosyl-ATP pyrophosphohydrolase/phosphoribosyl-AMP cyclohydrolase|nr:bifunctional phosphoribosyl-AMP cyclohydrolase/phosphoribosyl-ATP diphosphatase HisIE [Kofleriaceae bacterium]